MLRTHNISYVELNGKVPVPKRGELIAAFEKDPSCKVFLSTEAGGAGLNLQMADTLINFELPWNPAKKNQRIGRIDRLGQKSSHLTVLNFICTNSIEASIATGLTLKQSLFEGVLDKNNKTDFVDFSSKGRSQFLQELEKALKDIDDSSLEESVEQVEEVKSLAEENKSAIEANAAPTLSEDDSTIPDEEASAAQMLLFEESPELNIPLLEEEHTPETAQLTSPETNDRSSSEENTKTTEKMEEVMNQGVGFLAGLYEMATGESMGLENQKVEINKETGEVTLKFKLPGF